MPDIIQDNELITVENFDNLRLLVYDLIEKVRSLESERNQYNGRNLQFLSDDSLGTGVFSRGDTAWLLSATTLVFLMTIPGIILYNL